MRRALPRLGQSGGVRAVRLVVTAVRLTEKERSMPAGDRESRPPTLPEGAGHLGSFGAESEEAHGASESLEMTLNLSGLQVELLAAAVGKRLEPLITDRISAALAESRAAQDRALSVAEAAERMA